MNNYRRLVSAALILLVGAVGVFAANDTATHDVTMQVLEVALIDLNDTGTITLTTTPPGAGGADVTGDSDTSKLLQYTSLVATGVTRNITVQWGGTDAAPAGTSLLVEATSVPAGCGVAAPQVTLSSVAQNLVTTIGSCATGTGASGAQVTFTFSVDDIPSLVVGDNKTVTVTYTLTDAA